MELKSEITEIEKKKSLHGLNIWIGQEESINWDYLVSGPEWKKWAKITFQEQISSFFVWEHYPAKVIEK